MAKPVSQRQGDIKVDFDLLRSFSIVNLDLARDPEIVSALESRVSHIGNSRSVDLAKALDRTSNLPQVDAACDAAIDSVLRQISLQY